MTRLDAMQEALLARLEEADDAYRKVKISAKETARKMVEAQIEQYLIARDKIAAEAHRAGVPKRQIALRGLRMASTASAIPAIENGERHLPAPVAVTEEPAKDGDTFEIFDDGTLQVFLTAEQIAPYAAFLSDWDGEDDFAVFTVEGDRLVPERAAEDDSVWSLPVVQIVSASDKVWRNKALAYVKENG